MKKERTHIVRDSSLADADLSQLNATAENLGQFCLEWVIDEFDTRASC